MLSDSLIDQILAALPRRASACSATCSSTATSTSTRADRAVGRNRAGRLPGRARALVSRGPRGRSSTTWRRSASGRIRPIASSATTARATNCGRRWRNAGGASRRGCSSPPSRRTPTYTKPIGAAGEQPRELNRLDIKNRTPTTAAVEDEVIKLPRRALGRGRCADRAGPGERDGVRRRDGAGPRAACGAGASATRRSSSSPTAASGSACSAMSA